MFFKKGSKAYSIFGHKCPRCHEGDLYDTPTLSFQKPFVMKEKCPKCGQKYVLESGFYWGAMYVAYGLSSGWMIGSFIIGKFILGLDMIPTFIAISLGVIGLYVPIFRLARAIWINFFVSYKPNAIQEFEAIAKK